MKRSPRFSLASFRARHRGLVVQFTKFGLIGGIGFIVDYLMLHVGLDWLDFGRYGSAFFSFPFAVSATWIGNRLFTFRGQNNGSIHAQWIRFLSVCAIGLIINRGTYSLLIFLVPLAQTYPVIALIGGTLVAMFFNFFLLRRLVFK